MVFKELFVKEAFSNPETFGNVVGNSVFGGMVGALVVLGVLVAIVAFAVLYIYCALAWYTIARKLKHKNPWMAWIPFANFAMMLQLGGFHWAWVFLALIPILGWIALAVLLIISNWRIFEKRHYPGWFSLSIVIPEVGFILYLVAIGFVAWKDRKR